MRMVCIRTTYGPISTGGIFLLDDNFFAYSLEDPIRTGAKVPGNTAIPAGRYRVALTSSARFGKVMPQIVDVPGFEGVRIHGGNTAEDTEGCILIARNRVGADSIQGSMAAALTAILANSPEPHEIEIINAWRDQV